MDGLPHAGTELLPHAVEVWVRREAAAMLAQFSDERPGAAPVVSTDVLCDLAQIVAGRGRV
jgi:hypothetical protein